MASRARARFQKITLLSILRLLCFPKKIYFVIWSKFTLLFQSRAGSLRPKRDVRVRWAALCQAGGPDRAHRTGLLNHCFVLPHGKNHANGLSTRAAHDFSLWLPPSAV